MAISHGKNGAIQRITTTGGGSLAFTKIGETTNWTLTSTGDPAEIRRHGDNWVTRLAGINDWNATVEAVFDLQGNQTFISERLIGSGNPTVRVAFYVGSSSIPRYDGTGFANEISPSVPADGLQVITMSISGSGTLNSVLS